MKFRKVSNFGVKSTIKSSGVVAVASVSMKAATAQPGAGRRRQADTEARILLDTIAKSQASLPAIQAMATPRLRIAACAAFVALIIFRHSNLHMFFHMCFCLVFCRRYTSEAFCGPLTPVPKAVSGPRFVKTKSRAVISLSWVV